jgi:alpha-2-macroglobulin
MVPAMLTLTLTLSLLAQTPSWKQIEQLVQDDKAEAASQGAEKRLAAARSGNDEAEVARALVKLTQLRIALGGYETAVKRLKGEAWPKAPLHRATVELYYAGALNAYVQSYGWEIGQREKVDTKGEVDLKAWTKEQIYAEAARAWQNVWGLREALGAQQVAVLKEHLVPNDYPRGIRDTLRDAVTYLRVDSLQDSNAWTAEQQNSTWKLNFDKLIAGDPAASAKIELLSATVHPLEKVGAILDDLEAWHVKAGRREAALEARLKRLNVLFSATNEVKLQGKVRAALEALLPTVSALPWSATGRATLAGWVEGTGDAVKALAIAREGLKAFPDSLGGKQCAHLVARIQSPDYSFTAMQADGLERRSIDVSHKNVEQLYFRAWKLDFEREVYGGRAYQVLPERENLKGILRRAADVSWKTQLPPTPDYKAHRTVVVPPLKGAGLWFVAASVREDFQDSKNRLMGANILVTKLAMITRTSQADASVLVTVVDGETGAPVQGATVELWGFGYQQARSKELSKTSDANGDVRFEKRGNDRQYFITAKKDGQYAIEAQNVSFWQYAPQAGTGVLIFTDRSVFRPDQTIHWKAVAYKDVGSPVGTRYQVVPQANVQVQLLDPNHQVVETAKVTTNQFGSGSGTFVIPKGRLLGAWQLRSTYGNRGGYTHLRVEEYKRPTFETKFIDAASPAKLNAPVTLKGEARYYFGLPVASGQVRYRVRRTPTWPWWWWWYAPVNTGQQTVASGDAKLGTDGTFSFTFTPEADPDQPKEVTYTYAVEAEITDDGGETRTASKSFRLGQVAIEARVELGAGFFVQGQAAAPTVRRTDLDGKGRTGQGTWRLVALKQPDKAFTPAEEPIFAPPRPNALVGETRPYKTPGDALRSRVNPGYSPVRSLQSWADGAEVGKGELLHNAEGSAELKLPALATGAYRLRYSTKDDFGQPYETQTEFTVAGAQSTLNLPALFQVQKTSAKVGEKVAIQVASGFAGQKVLFEVFKDGKRVQQQWREVGKDAALIEWPVKAEDRGGFGFTLTMLRDYQPVQMSAQIYVPWDDKELKVEFATFRDTLKPGQKETLRVTVKGNEGALGSGAAEVLAYMYDQALDVFGPHSAPSVLSLYNQRGGVFGNNFSLGAASTQWLSDSTWFDLPGYPTARGDSLVSVSGYGIGGMGLRSKSMRSFGQNNAYGGEADAAPMAREEAAPSRMAARPASAPPPPPAPDGRMDGLLQKQNAPASPGSVQEQGKAVEVRSNFSETAFFAPQLLTDGKGAVAFEFQVPDSVTAWNVWAHAITKDLRGGSAKTTTRSVKDLMVRPYLPRFFREGDKAALKVLVNNAGAKELSGDLKLEILDPDTNKSVAAEFGLAADVPVMKFSAKSKEGATLTFPLTAPKRVGVVAFKVTARAGEFSDGELRPLPLLPSRMHLMQSKFATLKDKDSRVLELPDVAKTDDPTRLHENLVVTIDAQLFYSVLDALPYLVRYPYECTEQTLNRFVSTAIVSSVFRDYPQVSKMASKLAAERKGPLETFDSQDPNRKLALEESPWLIQAKGGQDPLAPHDVIAALDPKVAEAERASALAKLRKAQYPDGGFPWWPGGPASPYMTLYIVQGFSKAAEFKSPVPEDMVQSAWRYLSGHYRSSWKKCLASNDCAFEFITLLNYIASSYPDPSRYTGLSEAERAEMLAFSFRHWKKLSPLVKGYLALTLKRANRGADADKVFASVMDSSKTTKDEGTFWQPEDRSWLWYQDTIESHAFALRVMTELAPKDERRGGLVQWLLLNKKLNHWKSTRATAEVIYSLTKYLQAENALGVREESKVQLGAISKTFTFSPDEYTGKKNQLVVGPTDITPAMSKVTVSKDTKGFQFASVTWHFSTDQLPKEGKGDLFHVERSWFRREKRGAEVTLKPLGPGVKVEPGDEIEVQLSIRSRAPAEYVHLKDPRPAGLEPDRPISKYAWGTGIGWYEEYRDAATNFFFEALPAGEYTFKYRLRASMGGSFRVGPATLQSMYAPEFAAYSAGGVMEIATGGK